MDDLFEVTVDSLRVSLTNQQRIVVLKVVNQERYLPIWIGPYEAEAITIVMQEVEVARPQTHDLIKTMFSLLNVHMQKVVISELKDDIFFSKIILEADGKVIEIDARPSDAIAVALRTHVPILVTKVILEEAAIEPEDEDENADEKTEKDEDISTQEKSAKKKAKLDERLSVFEDYLKKRGDIKPSKPDEIEKKDDEEETPPSDKK